MNTILQNTTINQDAVKQEMTVAQTIWVQGIPFYVFNNKYDVTGAQQVGNFKQVIETAKMKHNIVNSTLGVEGIPSTSFLKIYIHSNSTLVYIT